MHKFSWNQHENNFTTGDALPLTDSSHIGLLVHPQGMYSFMPQLPEQLSSAIKPDPATLVSWYPVSLERQYSSSPNSELQDIHQQHQGW